MPKTSYSNKDVVIVKHKINFKKLLIIPFLILCLGFMIIISDLFSNLITVGTFRLSFFGSGNNVVVDKHTLYSLNMGKFTTIQEAENYALTSGLQGASGFIWQNDKEYYVVGNIYNSLKDAQSVRSNILPTNGNVFITEINFNKINMPLTKFSPEQRTEIKRSLTYLTHLHEKIYDYVIKIDKGNMSAASASSQVINLKADAIIISGKLDLINSTNPNEDIIKIKNTYVKVLENLNELVIKLINANELSHRIKYSYVDLIKLKFDLFRSL